MIEINLKVTDFFLPYFNSTECVCRSKGDEYLGSGNTNDWLLAVSMFGCSIAHESILFLMRLSVVHFVHFVFVLNYSKHRPVCTVL